MICNNSFILIVATVMCCFVFVFVLYFAVSVGVYRRRGGTLFACTRVSVSPDPLECWDVNVVAVVVVAVE